MFDVRCFLRFWPLFLFACLPAFADETRTNQLPPTATAQIDFSRDIQPILESACLRCHGPDKPKSHFRLDNRNSALRGGDENTNDIVPGNSLESLLVHYVARQVPDMEMPPDDKGTPLTPQQIALIRAWIDQGAAWNLTWNGTNQASPVLLQFDPAAGWTGVRGDQGKFRELEYRKEGFSGGVDDVLFSQQTGPDEKFVLEGHAIAPDDDFRLKLAIDETDRGFVHAGYEEWRKYYDDSGGYAPAVTPPGFNLNRDLYVDNGRLWVDLGLTRPYWPQIVLGYEYQFKQGNKSMLDWGQAGGENVNIAPATKAIDEQTHILKLDVMHDINDWHFEDNARVEFYYEKNRSDETNLAAIFFGGNPTTQDNYHHVQGMNTLMVEKPIYDWWLLSAGQYYSRLEGTDFFNQTNGAFGFSWNSQAITLRRESAIFSVASIFTPLPWLSFSVGSQNEWTREEGFGDAPDMEFFIPGAYENSSLDKFKASQDANLRFTKIPRTVLFTDTRFDQESDDTFQSLQPAGTLDRQTDAMNYRYDLRGGFNTSPWRWSELNAEYHWQSSDTTYDQNKDIWGSGLNAPTNGYPAFILGRTIHENAFDTRFTVRPANWLKTAVTYQLSSTRYTTTTDPAVDIASLAPVSPGGTILAGINDAQTAGINATLTPFRSCYFYGAFTYSWSRLTTANNGDPSVVPYTGNVYTVTTAANYALNARTGLQAGYNFSQANYGQNNTAGVPLGMDFTRHELLVGLTHQFNQRVAATLRYTFSEYSEPTSGNRNNYTANGIFAVLSYKWP